MIDRPIDPRGYRAALLGRLVGWMNGLPRWHPKQAAQAWRPLNPPSPLPPSPEGEHDLQFLANLYQPVAKINDLLASTFHPDAEALCESWGFGWGRGWCCLCPRLGV